MKTFFNAIVFALFLVSIAFVPVQATELSNGKELKWPDKFKPAPLYSDLLNALNNQMTWKTGQVYISERIRALFLPDFNDPSHSYPYNTNDGGARLAHQVKGPDGKVVTTNFYHANKLKPPFWGWHAQPTEKHKLSEGKHEIVWYLEGKEFYKFPFTVRVKGGDDPYNPGGKYFFDGPWSDYAYFYFPKRNPNSSATISLWLRDENADMGKWTERVVKIMITKDGETIGGWPNVGKVRKETTLTFKPWWIRVDLGLRRVSGMLQVKDLLADGDYEVTITADGKPFANYSYSAKGGKFIEQDRQVRDGTDPMLFIEGGGERFFLKKK